MNRPMVAALTCLVVLGCARQHLIIDEGPGDTRALATWTPSGWHITMSLPGSGWTGSLLDEPNTLAWKDQGARTQVEWNVPFVRWKQDRDFRLYLQNGQREMILVVENHSHEMKAVEQVALVVFVAAAVVVTAAAIYKSGSGGHHVAFTNYGPTPVNHPHPGPGSLVHPKGVPTPSGLIQATVETAAMPPGPVAAIEPLEDPYWQKPMKIEMKSSPNGWEASLEIADLPVDETWTVSGKGFETHASRKGITMHVKWLINPDGWVARPEPYELILQDSKHIGHVRVWVRPSL